MRPFRFVLSAYISACVLLSCVSAFTDQPVSAPESGSFRFEWHDPLCTLEAREARVTEILAEVSRKTGVPIRYDKDDPATVSLSLKDVGLEKLVRAVAENVVLTYVVDPESPEGYRVNRVQIDAQADEATRARAVSEQVIGNTAPLPASGRVKYSGIGAGIRYSEDRQAVHFQPIVKDAPVSQAGITPNDVIVAINGQPVSSFNDISDMTKIIRGPEGTPVTFTLRTPDGGTQQRQVVRRVVEYTRPATHPPVAR